MPTYIKHIFINFLVIGTFASIFLSGTIAHATTLTPQQTAQEDTSNIQPKEFDDDFKDRYNASEYVYEQEKSDGWFSRFINWLEETVQDWFDLDSRQSASNFLGEMTNLVYVLIIIVVVFFIVRAIMNGEGRWVFGKRSDKKIVNHEDVETNIHIVNFKKLISEAIANNDYRLAVRYQYLDMLKKLSAAEIISYDPEKTNLEYTYEIKNDSMREQFQYTSYLYNYVWYGEFMIDKEQYEQAAHSFNLILKNNAA
ncbi:DUF4129 domain-containing protein [Kordia algicida OT-1]|uniref:Protein-glutamine gamma-glutamyltransferase-like C-terminal domain-containing protein n=1 Tax=Kordia algicida OT-1 TaxID=391587 RepID=A9E692_9FLAO|nr:DUF4129 domain-containing protein [Kordia algicida]EDP94990.1 hypothetical protein KAOT1_01604 [Kordia algicida OT-1]